MTKLALLVGACLLALSLPGCTTSGQLTPAAQTDIQTALDTGCPTINALQPSVVTAFNGNVQTAYRALLLACPPNPAPTNPVIAGMDILDAITLLQPYLKKS